MLCVCSVLFVFETSWPDLGPVSWLQTGTLVLTGLLAEPARVTGPASFLFGYCRTLSLPVRLQLLLALPSPLAPGLPPLTEQPACLFPDTHLLSTHAPCHRATWQPASAQQLTLVTCSIFCDHFSAAQGSSTASACSLGHDANWTLEHTGL